MKKSQQEKQQEWIDYCVKKHNDQCDYSGVNFTGADNKVKIRCKKHDLIFEQKAANHKHGQGCPECGKEKTNEFAASRRTSQNDAIKALEDVHGKDRYDYSRVRFQQWNQKIEIGCLDPQCNGNFFWQNAQGHRSGFGCPECGIRTRANLLRTPFEIFRAQAIKIHGEIYKYDQSSYVNSKSKINYRCSICDRFVSQRVSAHLSQRAGCPTCSQRRASEASQLGEIEMKKLLNGVHGDRFIWLSSDDKWKWSSNIFRRCTICGDERYQSVINLMADKGCGSCSRTDKHTNKSFKKLLEEIHGENVFDYSKMNYVDNGTKINLVCNVCTNDFWSKPSNLLYKGCARCAAKKFASAKEIAWLKSLGIDDQFRGQIIHVGSKKFNLDAMVGNVVYEFNGDYWHGNPAVVESNEIIWSSNGPESAESAYSRTLEKEKTLREAGYELVTIWENDWDAIACNAVPLEMKYHNSLRLIAIDNKQWCFATESQKIGMKFSALNENAKLAIDVVNLSNLKNHACNWDDKKKISESNGLRFNLFFSDEWKDKFEVVKNMIKHRLGMSNKRIYARKCQIVELSLEDRRKFFDDNHLDGNASALFCFGLVRNGEIQAAMSIRKPQQTKTYNGCIEVARFAIANDTVCIGALGKLSKACLEKAKTIGYHSLMTYVDQRIGSGNGYLKSGWKHIKITDRRWWWTDGIERYDRTKFKARDGKSEKQVALESGVHKIYGCSNLVLKYQ